MERTICAQAELSRLDDTLADTFQLELERERDTVSLRASQRAWIDQRNHCRNAPCIRQRYEQRIAELSCDANSRSAGSAMGSHRCASFMLRVLDARLAEIEARYANEMAAQPDASEGIARTIKAEQKAWRAYRSAHCARVGAAEGGAPGWMQARAAPCEVGETEQRMARLQKELRGR